MIESIHSRSRRPPIVTSAIASICILVYVCQVVLHPAVRKYTLNPEKILHDGEWYRIITSSFMHGNLMHILMNMMSYFTLGSALERRLGSLFLFSVVLWSAIICSIVHVTIALALFCIDSGAFHSNSLGFSATLFHLLVLECNLNSNLSRNLFGVIHVSSRSYPFVLLILIQVLLPNISFLGHFSGIIVGLLQGFWGPILVPSANFLSGMDDRRLCTSVEMFDYINTSREGINELYSNPRQQYSSMRTTFSNYFGHVIQFMYHIAETIKFIFFGRGSGRSDGHGISVARGSNELDDLAELNPNSDLKTRNSLLV